MSPTDDDELWESYRKKVKPALRKKLYAPVAAKPAAKKKIVTASPTPLPAPTSTPSRAPAQNVTFDRKAERKLRQGDIVIDARLDLHGMRQDEAFEALERFMTAQVKAGHRNLLVITGKGSTGKSVLRANLAGWLDQLPISHQILSLRPAAVKHGGNGAFYVILRRRR